MSKKHGVLILLTIIFGSLIILGGSITFFVLRLVGTKITGNLIVDGSAFSISKCQSGQAFSFTGIQLKDNEGRRLRLFKNPADGTVTVSFFPANQDSGQKLGDCASLHVESGYSRVNYILNQSGAATLNCNTGGHKVTGSVEFKNCH